MSLRDLLIDVQFPDGEKSLWAALWGDGEHIMDKTTLEKLDRNIPIHLQKGILVEASAKSYLRTVNLCLKGSTSGDVLLEIGPGSGHNLPLLIEELRTLGVCGYVGVELTPSNFKRLKCSVSELYDTGCLTGYSVNIYESISEFVDMDGKNKIGPGSIVLVNADIMDFLSVMEHTRKFRMVLSTEVMLYIQKPQEMLKRLKNTMTSDGVFYTTIISWSDSWKAVKYMIWLSLGVWTYDRQYWETIGGVYVTEEGGDLSADMRKTCEVTIDMLSNSEFRDYIVKTYGKMALAFEPYFKMTKSSRFGQEYLTVLFTNN